jgi:glutamate dehydrogenase (NAD(P)+)
MEPIPSSVIFGGFQLLRGFL